MNVQVVEKKYEKIFYIFRTVQKYYFSKVPIFIDFMEL